MAYHISLSTVKAQLDRFISESSNCASTMRTIDSSYIDATNNEWNTPAAAKYIDSLCSTFNNYISQFNSKYQEGVNEFVAGVNVLADHEEAEHVGQRSITPLQSLTKGWAGQNTDFNIPQDYASFTSSHLTANIDKLIGHIESMQSCIDTAVANGLEGRFCTTLKEGLNKLKTSAAEVAKEYDGKAAQAAVNQDSAISTIQSNT